MTEAARRLPALSALPFFEAAARLGSFSAAARELNTSQPAVSHHIAHLEAELGVTLFVRGPRGAMVTAEARQLLMAVQEGFDGIARTAAALRARQRPSSLTLATDFGLAAFWLLPKLGALSGALPGVDVRILTSQSRIDLHSELVDLALPFGRGPWPGCHAAKLFGEVVVPVCSPDFLRRHGSVRGIAELASLPLLDLEAPEPGRWLTWADYLAPHVPAGRTSRNLGFNDYMLVLQAAMAGHGVALGWRPLVDDLLQAGTLVVALDRTVETDRGYYIVWPRTRRGGGDIERLRRWLMAQAGER
jgi:putative choline sulfate-utilization transcription factor